MDKPSAPVVFITGTSSGIGQALVSELLNSRKYRIVATCRNSKWEETRERFGPDSERFFLLELDLAYEQEIGRALSQTEQKYGSVDILVNNAGVSFRSPLELMSHEDDMSQITTNYLAPLSLIKQVLPGMRAKRSGRIINISSVGGMMAMPTMGSYSASKFALEGASEALWYELRPWSIHVSLIQPGFINSDGFMHVKKSSGLMENTEAACAYTRCYESMGSFIATWMRRANATPQSLARKIISVMEDPNPPLRIPATFDASLFSVLRRFLPRGLYHKILYRSLPNIQEWGSEQ